MYDSKWLEIHSCRTSTSATTIDTLRKSFALLGLPEVVVSENAQAFTSSEFAEFLQKNGIQHVRTPPYHPASNGLVERAVQTFKEGTRRLKNRTVETRLARFLLQYRVTPHSSTRTSPSELMLGRRLRTVLDLLHPDMGRKVWRSQEQQKLAHDSRAKLRSFVAGDAVYARNYRQGPSWLAGVVVDQEGSVLFRVRLSDGTVIRRHSDQLRHRVDSGGTSGDTTEDSQDPRPDPAGAVGLLIISTDQSGPAPGSPAPEQDSEASPTESHEEPPGVPNFDPTDQPTTDSTTETASPQPELRSTRARHPPDRYDEFPS